jgi:hypothetical protein
MCWPFLDDDFERHERIPHSGWPFTKSVIAPFSATAKLFIVAAGGIENARLLLLPTNRHSTGLGNQHGLVGRFFLDHPLFLAAALLRHTESAVAIGREYPRIAPDEPEPVGLVNLIASPLSRTCL